MSRWRRALGRSVLALGATLVALALLEVALRVAAHFMPDERGGIGGATTILCVGDSHTYGLHVLPSASYPAQLQARLDPSATEIGVINYGVPGRNSAVLLERLPHYLESVRPDVLLVLTGFNDTWNVDGARDADGEAHGRWRDAIDSLRVVKLYRLIALQMRGGRLDSGPRIVEQGGRTVVIEDGRERPAGVGGMGGAGATGLAILGGDLLVSKVERNLERIVDLARRSGATPVLLTYATENQGYFLELNAGARDLAARLGVPLIDSATAFREAIASEGYSALFFADDHPNARGNERFAAIVAAELRARSLVPETTRAPPETSAIEARLRFDGSSGSRARFVVTGPPQRDFQVALSPRREPEVEVNGTRFPIGDDPMIERCLENLNLRGRTDASGRASLEVDLELLGAPPPTPLFAVVAFFAPDAALPQVSPPIEVPPRG